MSGKPSGIPASLIGAETGLSKHVQLVSILGKPWTISDTNLQCRNDNTITMHRMKRPKIRLLLPESGSDRPPSPTAIDNEILRHKGTSVAIEATKESLQASKTFTTPSLSEIIEEKTRENGRLREELDHALKKQAIGMYLEQKTTQAKEILEEAATEYRRLLGIINDKHGILK